VDSPADESTRAAIDAIWRAESARLIAGIAHLVRDVGLAEDIAQDALVAALRQWPGSGVPENPGAWLMAVGRRRAIDVMRRNAMSTRRHDDLGREVGADVELAMSASLADAAAPDDIGDDLLRLIFVSCHPVLSVDARVALTLRLVAGLTTDEIARAFLVPEPTIAQRIVRAKKTLTSAGVPFEVPSAGELDERLSSVLQVIYLIFNEGYTASAGDDWMRPGLCENALHLARMLGELLPFEAEVHGLAALLEIQASRQPARVTPTGEPIPLLEQDRRRWNWMLIRRGVTSLERAERLAPSPGPYTLQAAIAACHARASRPEETDWRQIVGLYDKLLAITGSPIVGLNRAVAVGFAFGPEAGLAALDSVASDPALATYHLVPAVRADLLAKLGRTDEARVELERAVGLATNGPERDVLVRRLRELG
jgi:RNA polymerase sigma factor (sigma-70 family)